MNYSERGGARTIQYLGVLRRAGATERKIERRGFKSLYLFVREWCRHRSLMVSIDDDDDGRNQSLDINKIASESCDTNNLTSYVWKKSECYSAMAREVQSSRYFTIKRS
jgi:hypothetical protein